MQESLQDQVLRIWSGDPEPIISHEQAAYLLRLMARGYCDRISAAQALKPAENVGAHARVIARDAMRLVFGRHLKSSRGEPVVLGFCLAASIAEEV